MIVNVAGSQMGLIISSKFNKFILQPKASNKTYKRASYPWNFATEALNETPGSVKWLDCIHT